MFVCCLVVVLSLLRIVLICCRVRMLSVLNCLFVVMCCIVIFVRMNVNFR